MCPAASAPGLPLHLWAHASSRSCPSSLYRPSARPPFPPHKTTPLICRSQIQIFSTPASREPTFLARLFIQLAGARHTSKEPCLKGGEVTKGDSFPSQKTGRERATGTLRSESFTLHVSQPLLPTFSPCHAFSGTALGARFGGRLGDMRAGMAGI